ncbi:MAG: universal stress protein [Gammaproteobacteria bacterium]|jgi:nucleotide-binding universal stress UspA family protein
MFKHILVAADGSETAGRALTHAIALAAEQGAKLRVVNVVAPRVSDWGELAWVDMNTVVDGLTEEGRQILEQAAEQAQAAGVSVETALVDARQRHVGEVIASEAQSAGADLIVIGTHGRKGFSRLMLGSVAEVTLRMAHVPVLALPPAEDGK